ncbi:MAG: hypothetical protein U0840_12730 [Gemmataceae bacterium]
MANPGGDAIVVGGFQLAAEGVHLVGKIRHVGQASRQTLESGDERDGRSGHSSPR